VEVLKTLRAYGTFGPDSLERYFEAKTVCVKFWDKQAQTSVCAT